MNVDAALELKNIDKSFGGIRALRGANVSARPGEILGLCGENGAGKSTLLKVLSGVYPATSFGGEVVVFGTPRRFASTSDARAAGIAIVHQELMLVPELSVAANLTLGREANHAGKATRGMFDVLDDDAAHASAAALLARFGVADEIDPEAPIGSLGIGLQQVVEIVRALQDEARILVLDEPTAALTSRETARLMEWLRELRANGTTCIYVSHRMDEVFDLTDRITVLRDGGTVGTVDTKTTSADEVVSMMVGRTLAKGRRAMALPAVAKETLALEVQDLSVRLPAASGELGARNFAIERISLALRPGEVLAVCGAMGSGRTALLSTLFGGARGEVTGVIRVGGQDARLRSAKDAIAHGIALIPEDRKGKGLVLGMTVADNLSLVHGLHRAVTSAAARLEDWLGLVDEDAEELAASRRIEELHIRGTGTALVGTLSGGNQQKVVLGKWLGEERSGTEPSPRVLLLDEPTRGVDVGARDEIYALLEDLGSRGTAILLASSDLPEVLRLAHRVLVLRHGRLVAELDGSTTTEEEIVTIATGAGGAAPASPHVARTLMEEACAQ